MLSRQQKETQLEALRADLARANSTLAVDYRGLSVAQSQDLRRRLRQACEGQVSYRVAKNTLLRRVVAETSFEGLGAFLRGPTAIAIAFEDPAALAKALVDFAKDHEKLQIKGGVVEGEAVDADQIRRLAALPSKRELRAQLAGTLQAPLRNLAGALHALLGNLRNALEQRQQQLEGGAGTGA
jgi:large subunit ribosomal protein L10